MARSKSSRIEELMGKLTVEEQNEVKRLLLLPPEKQHIIGQILAESSIEINQELSAPAAARSSGKFETKKASSVPARLAKRVPKRESEKSWESETSTGTSLPIPEKGGQTTTRNRSESRVRGASAAAQSTATSSSDKSASKKLTSTPAKNAPTGLDLSSPSGTYLTLEDSYCSGAKQILFPLATSIKRDITTKEPLNPVAVYQMYVDLANSTNKEALLLGMMKVVYSIRERVDVAKFFIGVATTATPVEPQYKVTSLHNGLNQRFDYYKDHSFNVMICLHIHAVPPKPNESALDFEKELHKYYKGKRDVKFRRKDNGKPEWEKAYKSGSTSAKTNTVYMAVQWVKRGVSA